MGGTRKDTRDKNQYWFDIDYSEEELHKLNLSDDDVTVIDAVDYIVRCMELHRMVLKELDDYIAKNPSVIPKRENYPDGNDGTYRYEADEKKARKELDKVKESIMNSSKFVSMGDENATADVIYSANWFYSLYSGLLGRNITSYGLHQLRGYFHYDFVKQILKKDSGLVFITSCLSMKLSSDNWGDSINDIRGRLEYYGFADTKSNIKIYCEMVKYLVLDKFFYCVDNCIVDDTIIEEFVFGKINLNQFKTKFMESSRLASYKSGYKPRNRAEIYGFRKRDQTTFHEMFQDQYTVDDLLNRTKGDIIKEIELEKEKFKENYKKAVQEAKNKKAIQDSIKPKRSTRNKKDDMDIDPRNLNSKQSGIFNGFISGIGASKTKQ